MSIDPNWKTFLFLCIITLLTALSSPPPAADVDVIIIGAGWSGMGAADHLVRSNFSNFLVLEATNRTGGRTEAIKFGDPSVGGHQWMFEVGSNWIDGTPAGTHHKLQPIWEEALRLRKKGTFNLTLIPGGTQNMSNYWRVYDSNGKRADADGKIRKRAEEAFKCTNYTDWDITLREGLIKCGWEPKTEAEWAVDWGFTVDDPGFDARSQWLENPDPTYVYWGPDDMFVVDQNPRGFAHLLDTMTQDTIPRSDKRLVYNTIVSQIDYSTIPIKVTSKDGRVFTTKQVISTLPLGVLQHDYATLFEPALHHKTVRALTDNGTIMANLTKIFLQFKEPFWDNDAARWLQADSEELGAFPEWHNMNHDLHVPGSNTLFIWLGQPQSTRWESATDAEVTAAIMKNLQQRHPDKKLEDPVAFHITRHSLDPFRYGAYSGDYYGSKDADWTALRSPLKVNGKIGVYFAGEHTCGCCNGFTHGALIRGREIAAELLGQHIKTLC